MSLTPAYDELEARKKREEIELCGKNRGPHDYIPIEWSETNIVSGQVVQGIKMKRVTKFLCRICFNNIETHILLSSYKAIGS